MAQVLSPCPLSRASDGLLSPTAGLLAGSSGIPIPPHYVEPRPYWQLPSRLPRPQSSAGPKGARLDRTLEGIKVAWVAVVLAFWHLYVTVGSLCCDIPYQSHGESEAKGDRTGVVDWQSSRSCCIISTL